MAVENYPAFKLTPPVVTTDTKICIVTHVDADGVGAGLVVNEAMKLLASPGDPPYMAINFLGYANGIGRRLKEAVEAKEYDMVFVTDISLRNDNGGEPDMDIFSQVVKDHPRTVFFWCDHHPSPDTIALAGLDNLYWSLVTDKTKCGADLVYDMIEELFDMKRYHETEAWLNAHWAMVLSHDYDLWHKKIAESQDFNDAISILGPRKVFDAIRQNTALLFDFQKDRNLWSAITSARDNRGRNIKMALDSKTEMVLGGQKCIFGICVSYPSEVAHALVDGDKEAAAIVLCIGSHESPGKDFKPALSIRRADGSTVDLSVIGKKLGGGGHDYAAGGRIPTEYLLRAMLEEMIEYCSDRLA